MEPTTLIVSALSAAAGLIAKSALSEAAKDAYKKLRERLFKKHADQADIEIAVKAVETQPDSPARQALLAEELTKTQAAHDETLLHLAQMLIEAINQTATGKQTLEKYHIEVTNGRVGVIGDNAHIEGGIHFGTSKGDKC